MHEVPQDRIGDYEVLGTLGAGGMGRVYRVRNVISDRNEAMKILLPDLAGRADLANRFLREIKLVGSLNHPNVASLCTALTVQNQLIMVMEYVDGVALSELLNSGPLRIPEALNYLDQALAALAYAHSKGIIHRDIKPANMMLTQAGTVKLMDFGIARVETERAMTQTGTTLGSLDYMSPEQITGQPVDARADIYSIGVSLYEMITGQRPFRAGSDFELMAAHVKEAPRPPIEIFSWIPASLSEIIVKAMAKSPADRFQSAEEMRSALRSLGTVASSPPALVQNRSGTIVESARPATIVDSPAHTISRVDAYSGRGMTQVSPSPLARPENMTVAKRGVHKRPAVAIASGGVLLASIGASAFFLSHRKDDNGSPKTAESRTADPPPAPHSVAAPAPLAAQPIASQPAAVKPPALGKQPLPPPSPVAPHPKAPLPSGAARITVAAAGQISTPAPTQALAPAQPLDPQKKARLDELELQIDTLNSRAASVNNSLNNMQRSMSQSGLAMRGDMVTKQTSMNTNLAKAKQALGTQDPERASRFAGLAEADIGQLESFLGR